MAASNVISWEEYRKHITDFVNLSESFCDAWQIRDSADIPHGVYIYKKICRPAIIHKTENYLNTDFEFDVGCGIQDNDSASTQKNEQEAALKNHPQVITTEYHVTYSASYGVPVLYFNSFHQDGRLLPLEEIWSLMPNQYQTHIQAQKWTFVTQQDHPILGRPFFQVHPCHTGELMAQMPQLQKRNYVLSWLSAVGSVVGLELPLKYAAVYSNEMDE